MIASPDNDESAVEAVRVLAKAIRELVKALSVPVKAVRVLVKAVSSDRISVEK